MLYSTPLRLLCGLLTLTPIPYLFFLIPRMLAFQNLAQNSPFDSWQVQFDAFFRIQIIFTSYFMLLLAGSIVFLFKTQRVPQAKKALWAVVLFMGNMVALPIFWFIYIRPAHWKNPDADL